MLKNKITPIPIQWVDVGNRVVKYKNIPENCVCSKCNGTDMNCIVCKGLSVEKKLKWYQLLKKLKKMLNKTYKIN